MGTESESREQYGKNNTKVKRWVLGMMRPPDFRRNLFAMDKTGVQNTCPKQGWWLPCRREAKHNFSVLGLSEAEAQRAFRPHFVPISPSFRLHETTICSYQVSKRICFMVTAHPILSGHKPRFFFWSLHRPQKENEQNHQAGPWTGAQKRSKRQQPCLGLCPPHHRLQFDRGKLTIWLACVRC